MASCGTARAVRRSVARHDRRRHRTARGAHVPMRCLTWLHGSAARAAVPSPLRIGLIDTDYPARVDDQRRGVVYSTDSRRRD